MNLYVYDGTWYGFLSCVFDAWNDKDIFDIVKRRDADRCALGTYIDVVSDDDKAERVESWLHRAHGDERSERIYNAILSEDDGAEIAAFRVLRFGEARCRDDEYKLRDICVSFTRETQLLRGFVRFTEVTHGLLYAEISPRGNQLPLIAGHFTARMPFQPFIIYDTVRGIAAVSDGRRFELRDDFVKPQELSGALCVAENAVEQGWREYLKAMTIRDRVNLKLQRQMLPMRFRGNMTEFQ